MNKIVDYIVKHKTLIFAVLLVLLIVWVYLQTAFSNFRLFQDNRFFSIVVYFCILILFVKVFEKYYNKHPILTISFVFIISSGILQSTIYLEKVICESDNHCHIGYLYDKIKRRHYARVRHPDLLEIIINDSLKEYFSTDKSTFDKINIGDTVILKVSTTKDIYAKRLFPTHEEIERYRVPQHYIDGELQAKPPVEQYPVAVRDSVLHQSHKQIGYVFEKIDDDYYRHFLRVGIADSLTTLHEFYETDRLYAKAYKRIGVGDTVIVRTADAMPQINQVVSWRPTPSEIQKSRIPAPYTATATQNYTQAFVDSVMQHSHEQLGFVFDKYEDEHVGAYLEVGVSDTLTRTYLFYRYKKPYTNIFKTISIGDTVILRVSDSYPQINKVVKWKYVKEEEEKPANVAAPKESAESERNASIVDKGIETDFAIVYTKGINSIWPKYFVKLKYNNIVSDYIGIDDIYKKQIYESLNEGDTVIIQKPKSNSEKIQVLSWEPSPEQIEQCRAAVQKTENN